MSKIYAWHHRKPRWFAIAPKLAKNDQRKTRKRDSLFHVSKASNKPCKHKSNQLNRWWDFISNAVNANICKSSREELKQWFRETSSYMLCKCFWSLTFELISVTRNFWDVASDEITRQKVISRLFILNLIRARVLFIVRFDRIYSSSQVIFCFKF